MRTATFYIFNLKDLEEISTAGDEVLEKKKNFFGLKKTGPDPLETQLAELAIEKTQYRWSGLAYSLLAVFSKEKFNIDWSNLEYKALAEKLAEKYKAGIYIFSAKDENLVMLKPNGYFYTLEELEEFTVELEGAKPANPNIMNDAVKLLNETLAKITTGTVALLLIQ